MFFYQIIAFKELKDKNFNKSVKEIILKLGIIPFRLHLGFYEGW